MKNAVLDDEGKLHVVPTSTSSSADFNFLVGKHTVHHKKLKSRLTNSQEWIEFNGTHKQELILHGIGNLEQHEMILPDGSPIAGMALRLFDPNTKLWSIHWADSKSGKLDAPMLGSFENKTGYFFTTDVYNGRNILVQFKWDATDALKPVWSQAFSDNKGQTWEWNWYMYFSKI